MEIAILGLGCFWGPEIKFSKLDGIIKTEVGYCGQWESDASWDDETVSNVIAFYDEDTGLTPKDGYAFTWTAPGG